MFLVISVGTRRTGIFLCQNPRSSLPAPWPKGPTASSCHKSAFEDDRARGLRNNAIRAGGQRRTASARLCAWCREHDHETSTSASRAGLGVLALALSVIVRRSASDVSSALRL